MTYARTAEQLGLSEASLKRMSSRHVDDLTRMYGSRAVARMHEGFAIEARAPNLAATAQMPKQLAECLENARQLAFDVQ
jgi:hypothetical protein